MIWLAAAFIKRIPVFPFFVTLHGHDQPGATHSGGLLVRNEH